MTEKNIKDMKIEEGMKAAKASMKAPLMPFYEVGKKASNEAKLKLVEERIVPPYDGAGYELKKGQVIRYALIEGPQIIDVMYLVKKRPKDEWACTFISSVFNALTGARQSVGNYPGVTVERREGQYTHQGTTYEVVDLPGTYSLSSYSPEEHVAQEELLRGHNDVVVVLADAAHLKRSLVLLAHVLQTGSKLVLCLNMIDEAERAGQRIDLPLLQQLLGFPVVTTVAHKRQGIAQLQTAIARAVTSPRPRAKLVLGERLERALERITDALAAAHSAGTAQSWVTTRLLLGDDLFVSQMQERGDAGAEALRVAEAERRKLEADTGLDIALYVTERYYGFVDGLLREVITRNALRLSNSFCLAWRSSGGFCVSLRTFSCTRDR